MSLYIVWTILVVLGFQFVTQWSEAKTTTLMADGVTDTYTLIREVLGAPSQPEVPDCGHPVDHIVQNFDPELNRTVFHFLAHRDLDDDRCIHFDRQRMEFMTNREDLNQIDGDTVSLSWNFKLDANFQPSPSFTHLHQLKSYEQTGSGNPLISLTARKGSPNFLQIIHINNAGGLTLLAQIELTPLLGQWIHVIEEATYANGKDGKYSLTLTRVRDGSTIFTLTNNNIELWRDGEMVYYRGKWGIYRSLLNIESLRDEVIGYDSICIGKGADDKCT